MVRAGVTLGLTPEVAHALATQTALGAGRMLADGADAPAELRRKVTSPNGTTQAAIERLQAGGFESLVVDAIHAADARSRELGWAVDRRPVTIVGHHHSPGDAIRWVSRSA